MVLYRAYVDVLHHAWGKDLYAQLSNVPDSSASALAYIGESNWLDLPGTPDAVFQLGKPGKEKPVSLTTPLQEREWQLLMLLGWHARNFKITLSPESGIRLLVAGWIEMPCMVELARGLQGKIQPVLPELLEIREDRFVSLRIAPDTLFLSPHHFHYKIQGNNTAGGRFTLERCGLEIPWGTLHGDSQHRDIVRNTVTTLRKLEKGEDPEEKGRDPDDHWRRSMRDQFKWIRDLGLRKIYRTKEKKPALIDGLVSFSGL